MEMMLTQILLKNHVLCAHCVLIIGKWKELCFSNNLRFALGGARLAKDVGISPSSLSELGGGVGSRSTTCNPSRARRRASAASLIRL